MTKSNNREVIPFMEQVLREIKKSDKYKVICRFFDVSHCADTWLVGNCMEMLKNNEFKEFQDWVCYYFSTQYYKELNKATHLLFRKIIDEELNYTLVDCFDCLLAFILLTSWDGMQAEQKAMNYLKRKSLNGNFRFSNHDEDVKYGIDIFKEGSNVVAIQVKPISFLNKIYNTKSDKNTDKLKKYKKYNPNVRIFYMFYDKEFNFTFQEVA